MACRDDKVIIELSSSNLKGLGHLFVDANRNGDRRDAYGLGTPEGVIPVMEAGMVKTSAMYISTEDILASGWKGFMGVVGIMRRSTPLGMNGRRERVPVEKAVDFLADDLSHLAGGLEVLLVAPGADGLCADEDTFLEGDEGWGGRTWTSGPKLLLLLVLMNSLKSFIPFWSSLRRESER